MTPRELPTDLTLGASRRDAQRGTRPVLVAVAGQVASGKSTLARALAQKLGATCIEGDRVRDDLLQRPQDPIHEARWRRAFAPDFGEQVYIELLRRAEDALASGSVVLDACFPRASQRLAARSLARRRGAAFLLAECRVREETARARLAARDAESRHGGWQAIQDDLAGHWDPIVELAPDEHLLVESDGPVAVVAAAVLSAPSLARVGADDGGYPPTTEPLVPRPEAVTFDCWNTLLYEDDWRTAHSLRVTALQAAAREAGAEVSGEDAQLAFDAAWERHMRIWGEGEATGAREVALWGLAELGLRAPHPALEHLIDRFERASHSSRVLALGGARAMLGALGRARIPCALVCDTGLTPGHVVRRHLDHQGLLNGLAVQVFSDEVGVPKPDPRAFRAALEPLGVPPERALHVGDLRRTDVAGARGLGMTSVRIRARHDDTSELPEADHVVGSYGELGNLLGVDAAAVTEHSTVVRALRRPEERTS
ncbi:MAG: HAD-IA family hydrolase [Myxococcota bacterium]